MGLPGVGDDAITDFSGHKYPLNCAEDYFLRAGANIAFVGEKPVADADPKDLLLTGTAKLIPKLEQILKPEEVLKTAHIFCKGGRFAPYTSAWKEDNMTFQW